MANTARGSVYCIRDNAIPGWDPSTKCRPCVVLGSDGAGNIRVVPRTTRPRSNQRGRPSEASTPVFDVAGFFAHHSYLVAETDVTDHRGMCPPDDLATLGVTP